jgi:Ni,Fe-hydrogenase I cytochrome b subunit
MKQPTNFLGTYFDPGGVLRLERWVRVIAWLSLIAYCFDAGYNAFQTVSGAISGGYPLDWYFIYQTFARVIQGGVLFMLLQVAARILLILLDIEDNTRRASRVGGKDR